MEGLPDWLKVLGPKIAGFAAAAIVGFLGSYNIVVSKEAETAIITLLVLVMGGVYGLVKAWFAAKTNPHGVNSPKLAGQIATQIREDKKNGST